MVDERVERALVTVGGSSVAVEHRLVRGRRGTVVVFHGGHMRAGLSLGEAPLTAAGWTVLTPSRPGYGRTPLAAGPGPAAFADTTAALCSHLGLEEVLAVVGVSAGGPSAVAMAARHGPRVRSLVLLSARSSLPFPDGAMRLAARAAFHPRTEARTWAAVRRVVRHAPEVGLRMMMGTLSTLPAREVVEDLSTREREELVDAFARMRSGAGFAADLHQRVDPDLERCTTQPTLVVASRTDGQVRWAHAEQLQRAIPHATSWVSPSSSHLVWCGSGGPATRQRTEEFLTAVARDRCPG